MARQCVMYPPLAPDDPLWDDPEAHEVWRWLYELAWSKRSGEVRFISGLRALRGMTRPKMTRLVTRLAGLKRVQVQSPEVLTLPDYIRLRHHRRPLSPRNSPVAPKAKPKKKAKKPKPKKADEPVLASDEMVERAIAAWNAFAKKNGVSTVRETNKSVRERAKAYMGANLEEWDPPERVISCLDPLDDFWKTWRGFSFFWFLGRNGKGEWMVSRALDGGFASNGKPGLETKPKSTLPAEVQEMLDDPKNWEGQP